MARGDNTMQIVTKGEKGAMTNQDGDWMSFEEVAQNFGGEVVAVLWKFQGSSC